MNNIVKVASRLSSLKSAMSPLRQSLVAGHSSQIGLTSSKRQFTRTLWHMCSSRNDLGDLQKWAVPKHPGQMCCCGCGSHRIHTKAEKDLVDFLTEEIATEKKTQKKTTIPSELDGFKVSLSESEVTLTKKLGDETVNIYFNVNHTVDSDVAETEVSNMDKPEIVDMKSKPGFEVELVRSGTTLGFTCSFLSPEQQTNEDGYTDLFGIDEVTMYDGEWSEKTYAVAGEILDGNLYDLLMNLLEEKGVSNEFVDKLSDLSTSFEHTLYVSLLEKMQKFASGK